MSRSIHIRHHRTPVDPDEPVRIDSQNPEHLPWHRHHRHSLPWEYTSTSDTMVLSCFVE
ncbi:MAG: hypothetical protein OXC02_10005 [Rhodobacteraceae bacterium]|nr:hypothetical protein [Paracoccaceae bacterium]